MDHALLAATGIQKSFAGVHALKGVSFDLRAGEIHALVGENGAGKSTLIKVMTGAEVPDVGHVTVAGREVTGFDPARAHALGIAVVHQQPALFPDLTVAENLALGVEAPGVWRRVDWARRRRRAGDLLARVGASIDPERVVDTLTMPEQQLVEIARALGADAKVLILDEPTAALATREVEAMLGVVRRLRDEGVGIVYISHRLAEVLDVADRVTVLRDGRTVWTGPASGLSADDLVQRMVGDELQGPPAREVTAPMGDRALEVRALSSRAAGIRDVSLWVCRGEVLGMAGLVGSGRTQLAETIFGITPPDSGEVLVAGTAVRVREPGDAVGAGIGYVPEDRRRHGVHLEMSVASNSTLASLASVSRRGLLDRAAELRTAERYIEDLDIKTPSSSVPVGSLSGGNQQKVALARWLATSPSILILDEPTQGVDVRAKGELYRIVRDLAAAGMAVILISSDLAEVLDMSDRIAVMRGGTVAGILPRAEASPAAVLALALGTDVREIA